MVDTCSVSCNASTWDTSPNITTMSSQLNQSLTPIIYNYAAK